MELIYRKYMAASIAGILYSCLLAILYPDLPGQHDYEGQAVHYASIISIYMIYVFAAFYTYAVLTSIISERAGIFLAKKSGDNRLTLLVSLSLHLIFGLVLLWISLPGAILFFLTDFCLKRLIKKHTLPKMLLSICLAAAFWTLCLAVPHFY